MTASLWHDFRYACRVLLKQPLFTLTCIGVLAIGVAGTTTVFSLSVSQRIQEFGVRLALGAQPRHLLGLVLRAGMARVGLGVGLGLGGALGLARVVRSLLFGVTATDPLTFVVVTLLLSAVSLVACWLPMRQAAKVDPMVALRHE